MSKLVQMYEIGVLFIDEAEEDASASATNAQSQALTTEGISTCIAIILHGRINGRGFCAMYHWPGLSTTVTNEDQELSAIYDVFLLIENKILKEAGVTTDSMIEIEGICVIGGEKRQVLADETLAVSGTEKEVELLQKYTFEICNEMFDLNPSITPVFKNFLTEGTSTINIQVYATHVKLQKYGGTFFERTSKNSKKRLNTSQEPEESAHNKQKTT